MKERVFFIDYIKAFSITLIIVSHCIGWFSVNDVVNKAILSIHVPIFFIAVGVLKGYLQREEQLGTFIKKRSRQLLIPYLWFSIYNSAVKLTMMALSIGGALTAQALKDEAIEFFITGNGTVWFLMTLFLAETLFVWVKSLKKSWLMVGLAVILAIVPFLWDSMHPLLILMGRFMSAYALIVLGWYIAAFLKNRIIVSISSIILMGCWLWLVYQSSWDYSFFDGYFSNIVNTIPTMLCGCLAFILIISLIKKHYKYIEYIGQNSLVLMLVHPTFLLIGIYGLWPRLHLHGSISSLLFSIALILVVYALSLVCIPIINRYFPFLIGKSRK